MYDGYRAVTGKDPETSQNISKDRPSFVRGFYYPIYENH
ncbi:hypothetical protein ACEQPO_27865 [Bacillus sp. SL00103]